MSEDKSHSRNPLARLKWALESDALINEWDTTSAGGAELKRRGIDADTFASRVLSSAQLRLDGTQSELAKKVIEYQSTIAPWTDIASQVVFPMNFRSPTPAFYSRQAEFQAAAAGADREIVATVAPGERVIVRLFADGGGELLSEVHSIPKLAIVAATHDGHQIVPIGISGEPAQHALIVHGERIETIWFDTSVAQDERVMIAVFIEG